MTYCKICGEYYCKKHTTLLGRRMNIQQFSGSSPPEVFIGRWNYPNVYTGILSPPEYGNTQEMSSHEHWHQKRLPIPTILSLRSKLIYSRMQTNIKKAALQTKFLSVLQEVAMTSQSIATEFKLKKPIFPHTEKETRVPLIANAALVESARLEENPKVEKRVDDLVDDTDAKSTTTMLELERANIQTSTIIKLLSAGLLGLKKNRKLVPTRWSITAVDDTLSKEKLKRIRYYPEIAEIQIFHAEYLGNHYEFLLLPEKYSFEVIEIAQTTHDSWHDYESFFPRKKYADSVTGAYYANRLALTEYLEKIKRQASCIVFREIRPEYTDPLGVGILRQTSREAFFNRPQTTSSIQEALQIIQTRLKQPIKNYTKESIILKNHGKQKRISDFF